MRLLVSSLMSLLWASQAEAIVTGFSFTGSMTGATVADSTKFNSGGFVTVNNNKIQVPDNLIVQYPAAWVPWKDAVATNSNGPFEVTVTGNRLNDGTLIAAQIELAQLLLYAGSGFVSAVNQDGSLTIANPNGPVTVRINDPNAVYGKGYTLNPLFTADDENPSVTAFSGFPMCIPRSTNDPACPSANRPDATTRNFNAPLPLDMAPFLPGDYIEYSGINVGGEVIAFEIVVSNLMITTKDADPVVYVRIEDAIIGPVQSALAATYEFGDTRFIGYLSNAAATVTVNALDIDPCTGQETERTVGSAAVRTGDVRNKFIFRADGVTASKYTREYRIKTNKPTTQMNHANITVNQYVQPVTEWIWPEPLSGDIPPAEFDFSLIPALANGIVQEDGSGQLQQFGQLSPWPGSAAPKAPGACSGPPSTPTTGTGTTTPTGPATTPTATASAATATVRPGTLVQVGAKDTSGNADSAVTYLWQGQTDQGTPITFIDSSAANATFVYPCVTGGKTASTAKLNVTIALKSDPTVKNVTTLAVKGDGAVADVVTIDAYTWTTQQGGTINIVGHTNVVTDDTACAPALNLFFGTTASTVPKSAQGAGKYSWNARSTKKPASIVIKSSGGGSATSTTTTAKRRRSLGGSAMWRGEAVEGVEVVA